MYDIKLAQILKDIVCDHQRFLLDQSPAVLICYVPLAIRKGDGTSIRLAVQGWTHGKIYPVCLQRIFDHLCIAVICQNAHISGAAAHLTAVYSYIHTVSARMHDPIDIVDIYYVVPNAGN